MTRHLGLAVLLLFSAVLGTTVVVHPVAPVAIVVAIWVAIAGLTSAFLALLGFMVVLYTRPAEFIPQLAPLKLAKVGALASLGLFGFTKALQRDIRLNALPLNRWMAAFTLGVVVAAFLAPDRAYAMQIFKDVFLKILILYVLITNLVDSRQRALGFMQVIALCAALLGAYALYAKAAGLATVENTRAGAVGLLGDPNDLAMVLLTGLPIAVLGASRDRGSLRLGWLAIAGLTLGGVIVTQSRGGLLGVAACLYVLGRHRLQSRLATWAVVVVALLGLAVMAGIGGRAAGGGMDASATGRLDAWIAGARMFRYHPLAGVGVGHFPGAFLDYAVNPGEWRAMSAHNTWVQILGETGLVGIIPFIGLTLLTLRSGYRLSLLPDRPGMDGAVVKAQLATVAGVFVTSFFLSQGWNWFLYILIAQVAAVEAIYAPPDAEPPPETPPDPEPEPERPSGTSLALVSPPRPPGAGPLPPRPQ